MTEAQDRLRAKRRRVERERRAELDAAHDQEFAEQLREAEEIAAAENPDAPRPDWSDPKVADSRLPASRVSLRSMSTVHDDVPTWAWQPKPDYNAVAVGTMFLAAGRPAAGKTTFARSFAAQATKGTLPGAWFGTPVGVAWIGQEESAQYVIKPGMKAAGADLSKVVIPEMEIDHATDGRVTVPFLRHADMDALTTALRRAGVKLVVIDPIMSVIGSKTDVNRSNEVRSKLEPWMKVAEGIDGVVLGVAHLTKSFNGDVTAAINGSSAFGEVARSIWGFSKDDGDTAGSRVMSHAKNSLGPEGLSYKYSLEPVSVTTDSGKTAMMTRFVLGEETDRTVSDAMREASAGPSGPKVKPPTDKAVTLRRILTGEDGDRIQMLAEAAMKEMSAAGFSPDQTRRAREELSKQGQMKTPFRKEHLGPYYWQLAPFAGERDSPSTTPTAGPSRHRSGCVSPTPTPPTREG